MFFGISTSIPFARVGSASAGTKIRALCSVMTVATLSGCVTMATEDSIVRVRDGQVTRTDATGAQQVLKSGEWKSSALPEVKIERLPVWYVTMENSGVKAWRYGYQSEHNYRYIDPLSPIVDASALSATGWVTYLVKGDGVRDFEVRCVNLNQPEAPQSLGHLQGVRGEWRFTPAGGQTMAGYAYHLTSKGIFLFRNASAFTYIPSNTIAARLLPEGWKLAWHQKGDAEASRLLIVTRHAPRSLDPGRHQVGFYDINTSRILPETFEMSFIPGSESGQFHNRFYYFDTAKGPLTISLEDGLKQVVVRNVRTGAKRVAFERPAGIARIKAEQTATGRILIEAAVGFSDERIYDAEDFLASGQRTPPAP